MIKSILQSLISIIILAITGCANETRDSILRGDASLVNYNFCDAVSHYRTALALSPDRATDQKLDVNLQYAKKECTKFHYKKGIDYAAKLQLDDAATAFKAALIIDPDNKHAQQGLEQALNVKADNIMAAVDYYQDGMASAAKKDWRNAVKQFQRTLAVNVNHKQAQEQIDNALQKIKQAEVANNAAESLLEKKRWAAAIPEFGKVLAIDPAHPNAADKIRLAQAEIASGQDFYLKGEGALKRENRVEAAGLFKQSLQHNAEHSGARGALAELYSRTASELAEKGNVGNAVVFYTKTLSLQPDHKGASASMAALEDEIRQRISCNLAFLPLREYSRDPDLSNALYAALKNKMLSGENGFVKIIDNKPLEKLAEDNDVPVEKLSDGKNINLLKSLPKISVVLAGKVASFKISSDKKTDNLSKQYISGTNRKKNPEYEAAVSNARLASEAAAAARRAAAQLGGAFGLLGKMVSTVTDISSSIDIANTPEYIDEPVYSTWRYKVNHHKKKAEVSASFRLVDAQTGELLADEPVSAHVEFTADSVENPNPEIGIEDKPLPFESDDDLKAALISKATDQIAGKLTVTLQKYANKYLLAAKNCDPATDRLKLVENYMNFVYAVPGDSSAYADELKKVRDYLASIDITN